MKKKILHINISEFKILFKKNFILIVITVLLTTFGLINSIKKKEDVKYRIKIDEMNEYDFNTVYLDARILLDKKKTKIELTTKFLLYHLSDLLNARLNKNHFKYSISRRGLRDYVTTKEILIYDVMFTKKTELNYEKLMNIIDDTKNTYIESLLHLIKNTQKYYNINEINKFNEIYQNIIKDQKKIKDSIVIKVSEDVVNKNYYSKFLYYFIINILIIIFILYLKSSIKFKI